MHKLRSLLLKPIPMKLVVVTTTIPAIFKEYVGIRQFMGSPRNITQYKRFSHFLPSPQRVGTNFERYLSEVSTRYH